MATILELVGSGDLVPVDAALGPRELPERQIFMTARAAQRTEDLLEEMQSQWNIETTPAEQLDDLIHHYVTGGTLDYPRQFHELKHRRDGIWELKTADLRLFGFFHSVDCFVCLDVVDANEIKDGKVSYAGYCEQSYFFREKLDLNEPKYLQGREPTDVVSNCFKATP